MPERSVARLFLALWPEPATRAQLCAYRDAWRWPPGARPVAEGNLHLTLHFIGDFARERMADLACSLDTVPRAPIVVRLGRPEMWQGGTAVLRAEASDAVSSLHDSLGRVLSGAGVALDDRAFSPHVTLARKACRAGQPAEPASLQWQASGFALVESMRGPRAAYEVLRRFDNPAVARPCSELRSSRTACR